MMETSNWLFDFTLENATEDQVEAMFAFIVAISNAMKLKVGGGFSQEVDSGAQDKQSKSVVR